MGEEENCVHRKGGFCSLLQVFEDLVLGKQRLKLNEHQITVLRAMHKYILGVYETHII